MAQRHKYEYQVDADENTAGGHIVRMVGKHKRVLEIGAGPGAITQVLKHNNECTITAIEIDESAIEKLTPFCEQVYRTDLNDCSWADDFTKQDKFDAVVAGDVLEHLYDPWSVLKDMKGLVNDDGCVVLSLPHIGHSAAISCIIEEDFSYQQWGLLDKTHIRFFGIHNMQELFENAGFKIVDANFVVTDPYLTEFADRWRGVSKELKKCLSKNPFGHVYQVVIKAKPDSCSDKGLKLMSLNVPKVSNALHASASTSKKMVHRLKLMIFPYLSFKNRNKLADFLIKLGVKI